MGPLTLNALQLYSIEQSILDPCDRLRRVPGTENAPRPTIASANSRLTRLDLSFFRVSVFLRIVKTVALIPSRPRYASQSWRKLGVWVMGLQSKVLSQTLGSTDVAVDFWSMSTDARRPRVQAQHHKAQKQQAII
ncbi:hypothetical protein IG631_01166 [Alternaria alternata]|nr:hypothetical protein IG631_01166 [Alternaria alternata]